MIIQDDNVIMLTLLSSDSVPKILASWVTNILGILTKRSPVCLPSFLPLREPIST